MCLKPIQNIAFLAVRKDSADTYWNGKDANVSKFEST